MYIRWHKSHASHTSQSNQNQSTRVITTESPLNMAPKRRRAPLVAAANDPDPDLLDQSPSEKVVETTELLENILSFLPLKALLTCRKLSKRVKSVIDGSLVLREAMFLRPTRVPRKAWRLDPEIDGSGKGITSVRPVVGMIPLPDEAAGDLRTPHPSPHVIRTPAILNPIFPSRKERTPDVDGSRDVCDYVATGDMLHHIGKGNLNRQDIVLDMYLTQPPCRQAWVSASFSISRGLTNPSEVSYLVCEGLLELGAGITIRDLLEADSTVRGFVSVFRLTPKPPKKKKRWTYTSWEPRKYKRPEPRRHLEPEVSHNATLLEILRSLDIKGWSSANEPHRNVQCWLLDTTIATDEMWAGVSPYAEDGTE
jgi:hypothetical protein